MTVLRTIRVLGADNQTEICALNVQDGGQAAEIVIPQDWRTIDELQDIGTAIARMVAVLTDYQADPPADQGGV